MKRLKLDGETVRVLSTRDLTHARGGEIDIGRTFTCVPPPMPGPGTPGPYPTDTVSTIL